MSDRRKQLLTVKEFAEFMQIGLGRAYELVKSNIGVYSLYIGKQLYVDIKAFNNWLDGQTKKGESDA